MHRSSHGNFFRITDSLDSPLKWLLMREFDIVRVACLSMLMKNNKVVSDARRHAAHMTSPKFDRYNMQSVSDADLWWFLYF